MNFLFKFFFILLSIIIFFSNSSFADNTYFIDFTKVLNQSIAGSKAQEELKKIFEKENNKFLLEEKNLKKLELDLISQKKILSNDDYKNKVEELRKKVSQLQSDKQKFLNEIAKSRNNARQELLMSVNPIVKKYMEQNNIRLVIDKQNIILGDTSLEITDKIITILNQELKSIKIN